jgi:hypothetical protein
MTNAKRQALLDALTTIIEKADGALQDKLSTALEEYAYTYARSYRDMTRGGTTMIAALLEVIEEASGAIIQTNSAGLPDKQIDI